ncbi:MAG: helix-turn-helix transcriptional regulator [Kofleriaceae bacterium]
MPLRETPVPRTRRGGIVLERSIRFVEGIPMLRQRFAGNDLRVVVTHEGSLRALVEVRAGSIAFGTAGEIVGPNRFLLAVPPRSVLAIHFRDADVVSDGAGVLRALDRHVVPAIEEIAHTDRTVMTALDGTAEGRGAQIERANRGNDVDVLASGSLIAAIDPDAGAPPAIALARRALHDHLGDPAPVRRVARLAGMAPETLTRAFARAYGIGPKAYCHRARLFDAALRLLGGASVVEAALRVGFNDLSRFYAQFRGLLGATPGRYAQIRKRQDSGARGF